VKNPTYIIGIDEVGRGPLAGPVGVGVVLAPATFDWALLPGVTDSKKLTEKKRAAIVLNTRRLQAAGQLDYAVAMVSAKVIDRIGIVPATNLAMERALARVVTGGNRTLLNGRIVPNDCVVKLDGGLKAPGEFIYQATIIKGDSKEKSIGLASIVAKVTRDRYMRRLAVRAAYTPYNFDIHKGYGTKAHRAAVAKYGLSDQHRTSFCRNIVVKM